MRKELIDFGNYVLQRKRENPSLKQFNQVTDSDIENWLQQRKNIIDVGTSIKDFEKNEERGFKYLLITAITILFILCILAALIIPVLMDKGLK